MKKALKRQHATDVPKYLGQSQDACLETWSPVAVLAQQISKQTEQK